MRVFYFAFTLLLILFFIPQDALSQTDRPIPTYLPLKITKNGTIYVTIHSDSSIPKQNVNAVIDGLMSERSFTQNGKLYFKGWEGALIDAAKHHGSDVHPLNIKIANSDNNPDVIVILTSSQSDQGYSGLTTFITEHNMIKNSHITIYEANDLTAAQTSAVIRHEFGHALGLGHSNITSDLMYPSFTIASAFISGLDEMSIEYLYP